MTSTYIQNPSFEEYTACPQSNSAYPNDMWIDSVVGWYAPTAGTSDYFNSCAIGSNSVPNGGVSGYQHPFDGQGFCGFHAYGQDYTLNNRMWSEYIQTKLLKALSPNSKYKFTMRISKANDFTLAVKNIGANFSLNSDSDFSGTKPFNLIPSVLNSNGFLVDTSGWVLVEGNFLATGSENYLTIGWFGDTITSDSLFFSLPELDTLTGELIFDPLTYYLVDSLKLFQINFPFDEFEINVLTPNNDGINDQIDFSVINLKNLQVVILNRWGEKIWELSSLNTKWDGTLNDGRKVNDGTYFYTFSGIEKSGIEFKKSGFVEVIR